MRTVIALLIILAVVAMASVEIGMGTGFMGQVGDGTRCPLIGQVRMDSRALGVPVEIRASGRTWDADGERESTYIYGAGLGVPFGGLTMWVGGGRTDTDDYGGWIRWSGTLSDCQSVDLFYDHDWTESEHATCGLLFNWRL